MSYEKWKQMWRIGQYSGRLGQAFVNEFITDESLIMRKLYYLEDYWEADKIITDWLMDNSYYPNLPEIK